MKIKKNLVKYMLCAGRKQCENKLIGNCQNYKFGENQEMDNKRWFLKGMHDGIPISTGYFAVALTLGIAAGNAGLTALEATVMSLTMHASAGQFAAMELIASGAGYLEMMLTEIVVNLRYMLMSCSLSFPAPSSDTTPVHTAKNILFRCGIPGTAPAHRICRPLLPLGRTPSPATAPS